MRDVEQMCRTAKDHYSAAELLANSALAACPAARDAALIAFTTAASALAARRPVETVAIAKAAPVAKSPRILRMAEVVAMTGLSKRTIYREVRSGSFPGSVKLGKQAVGWCEADVQRWVAARVGTN